MYCNYHKHSYYSNVITPDSSVAPKDYALRAIELGHELLSSVEHGWQGRYIEYYELAKEYGLKYLFGTEAYFVKDRLEKDRTNAHIVLLAKNENGRRAINKILAEANLTGFYYRPRLDISLLLSLPANDVWVTSSCVAGLWKYDSYEDIVLELYNHFNNNFFLEVQNHNTESQIELNKTIINLSNKHSIQIIFGCDTHYIYPSQSQDRDNFLLSKGIIYEDEIGWYMDYPDEEIVVQRFLDQGVLTQSQISEAIENTNTFLQVEEYTGNIFSDNMKLPTLFPEKSLEEKNNILWELIQSQWNNEKPNIPQHRWDFYEKEIEKEFNVIVDTHMADYFLLDYEVVKRGKELGGMITMTGRGSAPSFYIGKLLGFTTIDRIDASVTLFPERFMTKERVLDAKTLPDIDFNLGDPETFAQAQIDVMGENHSYPMLAYGTLRPKAAWKMYARAKNVDFIIANEISEQIDKYESDVKHGDDEEEVDPLSYIDTKYHEYYLASQEYLGIVSDYKIHPCAYLLYDRNIVEEIGVIKIKTHMCAVMDGLWAEKYAFLKNDLLKVSVVDLIYQVYARIGMEPHTLPELIKLCENDQKVWDIYKNAYTIGINQVEQNSTRGRVAKYSPKNISELSAFVAAVRPGFQSMYKIFQNREPFTYGIDALDKLIQTDDMPYSFMLYQEQTMAVLAYAGIPISETYEVVKNIAKKRIEKVLKYQERFIDGMKHKIATTENITLEEAEEISNKTWQIIEDSSRYSFNSSHSYSVAGDSLYGAYLKAHYPIYFYEVLLGILEEKGEKDRLIKAINEAEKAFNIFFPNYRFGQDNRSIKGNPEKNEITMSLKSIKGFPSKLSDDLYILSQKQYNSFLEFLIEAEETRSISKKFEDLIKIGYFNQFGNNKYLLDIFNEFREGKLRYSYKHTDKTKQKRIELLQQFCLTVPNKPFSVLEQINMEAEILGHINAIYNVDKRFLYVMSLDTTFAPRAECYCLNTGKMASLKIQRRTFSEQEFSQGSIIYVDEFKKKPAIMHVDGEYVEDEERTQWWINKYRLVDNATFDKIILKTLTND